MRPLTPIQKHNKQFLEPGSILYRLYASYIAGYESHGDPTIVENTIGFALAINTCDCICKNLTFSHILHSLKHEVIKT